MNKQSETPTIDQVLFNFMAENENPTREILTEWIHRYPQYKRELVNLAVDWFQITIPLPNHTPAVDEAMVVQRGMDYVHKYMIEEEARLRTTPKTSRPFLGFVREARALHLTLDEVAEQIGLTPALFAKIDQRMIRYASLPIELLQGLVDTIDRDLLSGVQYLQFQPAIPRNQRFKSAQQPQVSEQTNFFDEVRADTDLSEEQRQRWLALEPKR